MLDTSSTSSSPFFQQIHRTYHNHSGVPLGSQTGWWDDQKRATKQSLPSYLRQNIPDHLLRALSRLKLGSQLEYPVALARTAQSPL